MSTYLEIEYKILLSEVMYHQILSDYRLDIINQYTQTNYYIMHQLLDTHRFMLRIREKQGTYELTLKEPMKEGNLETNLTLTKDEAIAILHKQYIKNSIFEKLSFLSIPVQDFDTTHSMQTLRTDINHPLGILSLDKNYYQDVIDYELELEVHDNKLGQQAFVQLLNTYGVSYQQNCPSKIKRLKQLL